MEGGRGDCAGLRHGGNCGGGGPCDAPLAPILEATHSSLERSLEGGDAGRAGVAPPTSAPQALTDAELCDEWELDPSMFALGKCIGSGSYATVFLAHTAVAAIADTGDGIEMNLAGDGSDSSRSATDDWPPTAILSPSLVKLRRAASAS